MLRGQLRIPFILNKHRNPFVNPGSQGSPPISVIIASAYRLDFVGGKSEQLGGNNSLFQPAAKWRETICARLLVNDDFPNV